jgi:uncharacterized protein YigA (DUF484 family)
MRAEEVAHYLQATPSFFEEYAEFMSQIVIPHPHGGRAISITERQMLTLRDRNKVLEAKLSELVRFGEDNDAISEKMHRLGVGLTAAATFHSVLHAAHFHLSEDFALPHVAIRLWELPATMGELPAFAGLAEEAQVFAETLSQPYCGSTSGFDTSSWFGEAAGHIRSQALIALRDVGGTIGMLALGAEDAERFYADMGTLYLERLGELLSAALVRTLRLQAPESA